MKSQGCIIGIDIGTTSVKAVAFNHTGQEIGRDSRHLEMIYGEAGSAEQNPHDVYEAVMSALTHVLERIKDSGHQVTALGFSSAMHSVLPVNATGEPLSFAMTWMDIRAKQQADRLWQEPSGRDIYTRTGTPIHPMSPLVKLLWMREQRPAVFNRAAKLVSLKEWVWYQWFREWEIDASMASASGLYNLRSQQWDELALRTLGIGTERLSRVVSTRFVRTQVADERLLAMGMGQKVSFNIGASDGVLANLGVSAIDKRAMVVTIGTSCAVRLGTDQPMTDDGTRSFCYVLDDEHFIVGGPSNNGGIVLDWLYHQVIGGPDAKAHEEQFAEMLRSAQDVEVANLFCLPYVAGERAPLWNAEAKASFIGLQLHHTAIHLLRAAVEGILFNAYWIAKELFEQVGRPDRLVASGKLLEVPWARQMMADIFGVPVQYGEAVDASVVGAVYLAAKAEQGDSLESAIRWDESSLLAVNPTAHAHYQAKFTEYRRLSHVLQLDLNE